MLLRFVSAALFMLLIACGELPKPFASKGDSTFNPLVVLSGGGAIKVVIDPNVPNFISQPLAKHMVNSLIAEDIPASSNSNFSARYILWGQVTILNSTVFEPEKAEIRWFLSSLDDDKNFSLEYVLSGKHPGWLFLDKEPLLNIKTTMGKDVAKLLYINDELPNINPEPVRRAALPPENTNTKTILFDNQSFEGNPKIFVSGVIGAPVPGNHYLFSVLRKRLVSSGATVVDKRKDSNFLIKGFVNVSSAYDMRTNIAITWLVATNEGKELGKVSQKNHIPTRRSDKQWQKSSFKIVMQGISGIMRVINEFMETNRKKFYGNQVN